MTLSTPDIERLKGLLEFLTCRTDTLSQSATKECAISLRALLSDRADLEAEIAALESDVTELMANCNMSIAIAQAAEAENARLRERATAWRKALDLIDPSKPLQYAQAMHDFRADIDRALLHEGEK